MSRSQKNLDKSELNSRRHWYLSTRSGQKSFLQTGKHDFIPLVSPKVTHQRHLLGEVRRLLRLDILTIDDPKASPCKPRVLLKTLIVAVEDILCSFFTVKPFLALRIQPGLPWNLVPPRFKLIPSIRGEVHVILQGFPHKDKADASLKVEVGSSLDVVFLVIGERQLCKRNWVTMPVVFT